MEVVVVVVVRRRRRRRRIEVWVLRLLMPRPRCVPARGG